MNTDPTLPPTKRAYSYLRFSRLHQKDGDSERRQSEATLKYCREKNLHLDESLSYEDRGISAFKGRNAEKGALGRFIDACSRGIIPPGSALIVENLDRLSRQSPRRTVRLLTELLDDHRIEVHLTMVNKVFVPEKDDGVDLIFAVALAMRAHEESEAKGRRLAEAFANKRKRAEAGETILHPVLPWWLTLDETGKKIICPPDRAAVVKRAFELTAKGWSSAKIARLFFKEAVPTWRPVQHRWSAARIRDLVRGDAVEGHISPLTKAGRKHTVKNYYPRIISEELAAEARAVMKRNTRGNRGRVSSGLRPVNLLKNLVRYRGAWMRFNNHQNGPRDPQTGKRGFNSYYECVDLIAGKALYCTPARQLESIILTALSELQPADFRPIEIDSKPVRSLFLKAKAAELEAKVENLVQAIETGSIALAKRLAQIEAELTQTRKDLATALTEETVPADDANRQEIAEIRDLRDELKNNESRERISAALRRIIIRVDVGPEMSDLPLSIPLRGRFIRGVMAKGVEEIVDVSPIDRPRKSIYILVTFVGGAKRLIYRDESLINRNVLMSLRVEDAPA